MGTAARGGRGIALSGRGRDLPENLGLGRPCGRHGRLRPPLARPGPLRNSRRESGVGRAGAVVRLLRAGCVRDLLDHEPGDRRPPRPGPVRGAPGREVICGGGHGRGAAGDGAGRACDGPARGRPRVPPLHGLRADQGVSARGPGAPARRPGRRLRLVSARIAQPREALGPRGRGVRGDPAPAVSGLWAAHDLGGPGAGLEVSGVRGPDLRARGRGRGANHRADSGTRCRPAPGGTSPGRSAGDRRTSTAGRPRREPPDRLSPLPHH